VLGHFEIVIGGSLADAIDRSMESPRVVVPNSLQRVARLSGHRTIPSGPRVDRAIAGRPRREPYAAADEPVRPARRGDLGSPDPAGPVPESLGALSQAIGAGARRLQAGASVRARDLLLAQADERISCSSVHGATTPVSL
jgi:hypothetical protein